MWRVVAALPPACVVGAVCTSVSSRAAGPACRGHVAAALFCCPWPRDPWCGTRLGHVAVHVAASTLCRGMAWCGVMPGLVFGPARCCRVVVVTLPGVFASPVLLRVVSIAPLPPGCVAGHVAAACCVGGAYMACGVVHGHIAGPGVVRVNGRVHPSPFRGTAWPGVVPVCLVTSRCASLPVV